MPYESTAIAPKGRRRGTGRNRAADPLDALLTPRSIALIGASRSKGKVGHAILENLVRGGFRGDIVPVNPKAEKILGIPCFADPRAYPGRIDLGIVTVPARAVPGALEALIHKSARAAIVVTAGFKETGTAGRELEGSIAATCRQGGLRLLGPNVVGLINTHHAMNASFALAMPRSGSISVLAQSGAVCSVLLDWAKGSGVGLGKLVSIGNKADLSEVDLLAALAEDEKTSVIAGYLEDIVAGDEFMRTAASTGARKPVVLLKAGTTEAGMRAASSHTGSLAGTDTAYAAAFRRAGVIRAETFEELLDFATAFSMQPLPRGNRVAVITNAGGLGILAADAVEKSGMAMASLDEGTRSRLKAVLSPAASLGNPIDILGDSSPATYAETIRHVEADPGVDAVVVLFAPQAMSSPSATVDEIRNTLRGEKPVLSSFMGGFSVSDARRRMTEAGLPSYPSAERAVAALEAMVHYASWRNRPPRVVARFPANRRRVDRILSRHVRTGRVQVGEVEAKQVLRAYGFTVPPGDIATTSPQALEIAERIGYPVAMKISSPEIIHKSEVNGVRLNLSTPQKVEDAFDLMMLRIGKSLPAAARTGVYVEKMAPRGREVIIGMHRDPHFGPMLMFGLGGIFVEVMKDVTFNIAPITEEEAMQMLRRTRSWALLRGVRGRQGVDVGRIAAGLQRLSQLVTDFPAIVELDINPFVVGHEGREAVVCDARMTLSMETTP